MKIHLLRAIRLAVLGCFFMAVLVLMTSTLGAYSVTVMNDSGQQVANVELWISYLLGAKEKYEATIPAGQSHTFSTGALCPALLSGTLHLNAGWWVMIPDMGCAGLNEGKSAGGTCCWNSHWKIQPRDDGAYHFIKQ